MIKIGFTGDFCPWQRVEKEFQKGNWEHMFESVLPFFKENDFNIVDLECPLTTTCDWHRKNRPAYQGATGNGSNFEVFRSAPCSYS